MAASQQLASRRACLSSQSFGQLRQAASLSPWAGGCLRTSILRQQQQQTRSKATAARTRRALRVQPHPDFVVGPDPAAAAAARAGRAPGANFGPARGNKSKYLTAADAVVYNPPAAAPSVYHTPFKFLPRSDPRRRANLWELFAAQRSGSATTTTTTTAGTSTIPEGAPALPPMLAPRNAPSVAEVSEADVAEMRALRASDPRQWSVAALAKHFNCSRRFVMMAARASEAHVAEQRERLERLRERWGPKKREAKEERWKRRGMMERGEL